MVDPNLVDLNELSEDVKVKIVKYVTEVKKISSRDLGYTPQLINMVKHGKVRPSDELVKRCLKYLSNEEFAKIVGKVPEVKRASIDDLVKVIQTARVDSNFRELLLNYIQRYLGEYVTSIGRKYVVTQEDIDKFVKSMSNLSGKTRSEHLRYLQRACLLYTSPSPRD